MVEIIETGRKLFKSNFSLSPSAFKRLVLQTIKNKDLFGKRLNILWEKEKMLDTSFVFFSYNVFILQNQISPPGQELLCSLQTLYIWTSLKFCRLVKDWGKKGNQSVPKMKSVLLRSGENTANRISKKEKSIPVAQVNN